MTSSSSSLTIAVATEQHRAVLERLWTMFRHDMSETTGALPDAHARFRQERLDAGLAEPGWRAHLLRLDSSAVGLAVLRGLDGPEGVISSFFLVRAARRRGLGRRAVGLLTQDLRGPWAVAFQDANVVAARFWPAVAAELDPQWSLDRRPVPGRPDLPPDSWVRFSRR